MGLDILLGFAFIFATTVCSQIENHDFVVNIWVGKTGGLLRSTGFMYFTPCLLRCSGLDSLLGLLAVFEK